MAISLKEFMNATRADLVGDRLIVGMQADRRFVGSIEGGTFSLNADGQEIAAAIEAGTYDNGVPPPEMVSGIATDAGVIPPPITAAGETHS